MLARILIFLAIALLIFLPFNWLACRQLLRIHPKRKRWVIGAVLAGNLMWLFIPVFRNASSASSRLVRATLGPLWFGWTSFVILYSAFLMLVWLAWVFRRRKPFSEFARGPSRGILTVLIAGFLIGIYQAVVPLHVERVSIHLSGLPPSLEGKKLVLMGDLHVGLFSRPSRLQAIFETAGSLQPDAVIIAGDLIDDDPYYVAKLLRSTAALDPSIPLIAVLGNHEMYGDPHAVIESMKGSRIRLLINEGYALGDLWLAGISDPASRQTGQATLDPDLGKALAAKPPQSLAIAIAHQPRVISEAKRLGVPLAVCAHTHGGQLGFRPLRWSLAGVFLPYHMGLYQVGPTQLYVNTGTGYWLLPFRLGMPPEITLLELKNTR